MRIWWEVVVEWLEITILPVLLAVLFVGYPFSASSAGWSEVNYGLMVYAAGSAATVLLKLNRIDSTEPVVTASKCLAAIPAILLALAVSSTIGLNRGDENGLSSFTWQVTAPVLLAVVIGLLVSFMVVSAGYKRVNGERLLVDLDSKVDANAGKLHAQAESLRLLSQHVDALHRALSAQVEQQRVTLETLKGEREGSASIDLREDTIVRIAKQTVEAMRQGS